MRLGRTIWRACAVAAASAATLAVGGTTASAHVLEVDPFGSDAKQVWVGGPLMPADRPGQGLVPGGPGGAFLQPPSHYKGLNTACAALRSNGNGVVDMWGPPHPATCSHGGPPPAS
jgi:hypothetical protein